MSIKQAWEVIKEGKADITNEFANMRSEFKDKSVPTGDKITMVVFAAGIFPALITDTAVKATREVLKR